MVQALSGRVIVGSGQVQGSQRLMAQIIAKGAREFAELRFPFITTAMLGEKIAAGQATPEMVKLFKVRMERLRNYPYTASEQTMLRRMSNLDNSDITSQTDFYKLGSA